MLMIICISYLRYKWETCILSQCCWHNLIVADVLVPMPLLYVHQLQPVCCFKLFCALSNFPIVELFLAVCVYVELWNCQYCHSHNNWGPQNSFQLFLVPVYYWKNLEKPETDPQLLWEWQYLSTWATSKGFVNSIKTLSLQPLHKIKYKCLFCTHTG